MDYSLFEDDIRKSNTGDMESKYSPYCDLIYYHSSVSKDLKLAMLVKKPKKPSYILATTHGWHMSIPEFEEKNEPIEGLEYLTVHVDMRGRAFSTGKPDCNGLELFDIIDAVNYVKTHYKEYIKDEDVVYFQAGSGGGGNALALIGKFPDYFAHCTALYGISDYAKWYNQDKDGSFIDELDVWIGSNPIANEMAYRSRSGLTTVSNQLTPLLMVHGAGDIRVPVSHSREYYANSNKSITKYMEIENMGDMSHTGNASESQLKEIDKAAENLRRKSHSPIEIPPCGEFVVPGYLVTKEFSVILDNIDYVAKVKYDLNKDLFEIISMKNVGYRIIKHEFQ